MNENEHKAGFISFIRNGLSKAVTRLEMPYTLMHIFAISSIALGALGYVMTRVVIRHFTPQSIAFLRYFFAALVLLIYAIVKKAHFPRARDIPLFILGGAVGYSIYVYVLNIGSQTVTASLMSLVMATSPIITAVLAYPFLHEKMERFGWIAVTCSFAGVGIVTFFSEELTVNLGIFWILTAAFATSCYTILSKKLMKRYSPLEITTNCTICGAILLCVFAPRSFSQVATAAPIQIISILILAVFSSAISYTLWATALKRAKNMRQVTSYIFLTPVITTFLGFVMINETPHISVYIGGAVVLVGLLLMNRKNHDAGKSG